MIEVFGIEGVQLASAGTRASGAEASGAGGSGAGGSGAGGFGFGFFFDCDRAAVERLFFATRVRGR